MRHRTSRVRMLDRKGPQLSGVGNAFERLSWNKLPSSKPVRRVGEFLPRVTAERHRLGASVRATELAGQHWPKVVGKGNARSWDLEREKPPPTRSSPSGPWLRFRPPIRYPTNCLSQAHRQWTLSRKCPAPQ